MNGNKLSFSSEPLIYQNTNLVPLREIAEGLGATLNYDNNSGTIGVTKGNSKMTLTVGSKIVFYNGSSETVSAAPKVIKGVTYVPAQVFARGLGAGIELDSSNNSLKITY
ncbi:copper amine oxidase N-terminal domain-containing protein [Paenibacillus sp. ALE3]|uniref:copper amine oxidase N-terminal domain-containing protein n=1 Tax=Paenibacillus TaxID=44249 RepID=UPI000472F7E4|nr:MULTISPECIES: copper amine oxidase N-terminal domain-containing protein [Paenibacillus]